MTDNTTFTREISGRTITFRLPTDAQFLVIGRMVRRAGSLNLGSEKDAAKVSGSIQDLSKVLDILDSMVVDPADRDWLEEQIVEGKLNMEELFVVFRAEEEPTNRATKRATKKATSSRARTR